MPTPENSNLGVPAIDYPKYSPYIDYVYDLGLPGQYPLATVPGADAGLSNRILYSLLSQLHGPSLEGVAAAAGIDPAAMAYQQQGTDIPIALGARGLGESGAVANAKRLSRGAYLGSIQQARTGAAIGEDQRKQGLLQQLLQMIGAQTEYHDTLSRGILGQGAAANAEDNLEFQQQLNLGVGIAGLLATLAGGAYGAGVGGTGGISGAARGALSANQVFNAAAGRGGNVDFSQTFDQLYNNRVAQPISPEGGYQIPQQRYSIGRDIPLVIK
jgi:hypothetical protein